MAKLTQVTAGLSMLFAGYRILISSLLSIINKISLRGIERFRWALRTGHDDYYHPFG
jgi:hypothetical protein